MVKNVESGCRDAAVLLDGSECSVNFTPGYNVFEIENDSSDDVVASIYSGKTADNDGVRVIKPGCSGALNVMSDTKTIYLTGTGKVYIAAGNVAKNSFNSKSKGGGKSDSLNYGLIGFTGITLPYIYGFITEEV